jgi:hypothetical protein
MKRRFITKQDIDVAADAGQHVIEVDDRVTVTDVAREHAAARGVRIAPAAGGVAAAPVADGFAPPPGEADVHATVRAEVIARLGSAPEDLDAVIRRVLGRADR